MSDKIIKDMNGNPTKIYPNIVMHTGKNADEKIPETLGFINEEANTGFMATLFTLLSNIKGIKSLIDVGSKYLFPLAFALKIADWFLYLWKFMQSSNKNLGKTSNLFAKTITTALVGLAVFGTALISAAFAPILFSIAVGIDALVSLGKSIYFGIEAAKSKDLDEKAFYKSKAKENAIKAGVGAIILTGIVVGMIFAPYVATGIVIAVALTVVATIVTLGVIGLVEQIRRKRELKSLRTESVESQNMESKKPDHHLEHEIKHSEKEKLIDQPMIDQPTIPFAISTKKYTGFF